MINMLGVSIVKACIKASICDRRKAQHKCEKMMNDVYPDTYNCHCPGNMLDRLAKSDNLDEGTRILKALSTNY